MDNDKKYCSFCAKNEKDVSVLIMSLPDKITGNISYICNECVSLCVEVLIFPDKNIKTKVDDAK